MPKKYQLKYRFSHIPPVMRRGTHALAVIMDQKGRYYLGGKHIYPPGIYRLIGGGVNTSESPRQGLVRELAEETGLEINPPNVHPLAHIKAQFADQKDRQYTFNCHLFKITADPRRLKPRSDLDEIKSFTPAQLRSLINKYKKLPTKLVHLSKIPDTEFRWSDYGRFFSKVHQIALDQTQSN